MSDDYPIVSIDPASRSDLEPLGSKPKFWVRRDDGLWLFKFARENTGEDWAEKVAAEIAHALGIDAPQIELAEFQSKKGCICKSFIDRHQGEALVHGNEILAGYMQGYDPSKIHRQSSHTIENILASLRAAFKTESLLRVATYQLAHYLIFDALIGNTDRHHENWGLKLQFGNEAQSSIWRIAPTFDHASSLGRELTDATRLAILNQYQIEKYVMRGHGGIYVSESDKRGAAPLSLAIMIIKDNPTYFSGWEARLSGLNEVVIESIIQKVPNCRASEVAKQFAVAVVNFSRGRLLEALQ